MEQCRGKEGGGEGGKRGRGVEREGGNGGGGQTKRTSIRKPVWFQVKYKMVNTKRARTLRTAETHVAL